MKTTLHIVVLLFALLIWSCKREVQDLEANPWEADTDLQFVYIDSTIHSPSLGAFFMYFHVDYTQVPVGHRFIYVNVYKDGAIRNTQPFGASNARIVQANAVSGQAYSYELAFIDQNNGDTTRKFGPFVYLVP
jgi:hypothetical protein